jgi:hypothetical protein
MDWAISVFVALGISILGCGFWLLTRGSKPEPGPKPYITDREFEKRLEEIMRIPNENTRLQALAELYNDWSNR